MTASSSRDISVNMSPVLCCGRRLALFPTAPIPVLSPAHILSDPLLADRDIHFHNTVCVCVFSSHSFWTSSSLDVPAGDTQEEGHTRFLIHLLSAVRALIFLARRIQPFLSLVDCEVEFCVLTI